MITNRTHPGGIHPIFTLLFALLSVIVQAQNCANYDYSKCPSYAQANPGMPDNTDRGPIQVYLVSNANGVHATPTLFINGTKYEGAKDAAALRAIFAGIQKPQPPQGQSQVKMAATK